MAAALSYYTVFSLPGLLLLVLLAAGFFADPGTLREQLLVEIAALVGSDAAQQVGTMLRDMDQPGGGHPVLVMVGVAAMLFAATGAFAQLQGALNRAWRVEPDPARGAGHRGPFPGGQRPPGPLPRAGAIRRPRTAPPDRWP